MGRGLICVFVDGWIRQGCDARDQYVASGRVDQHTWDF